MAAIVLSVYVLIPRTVVAQSADMAITATPGNPAPGQQVFLKAQSFSLDLNQTVITWKYNGALITSGTGKTEIVVTAPKAGQTGIIIATTSGTIIPATASITLRPASVDLLWEAADSYTPPFYKGKALPADGALIRVVGIPAATAPKNNVFKWSHNDEIQQDSSGYNKSSFVFQNGALATSDTVELTLESGSFVGTNAVTITPVSPSLVAYQNNDGFINYAIGSTQSITTNQAGLILHFEPFFFSFLGSIMDSLNIEMSAGDTAIAGDPRVNELRLSRPDEGGESRVNLAISTVAYSLQHIERLFTILFN